MTPTPEDRYVLPETRAMAIIGCVDLLATVYLLATHQAHEANPLFAPILDRYGPLGFALAKALLLAVPLTIAEAARRHNPHFVRRALRIGLVLYILLLLIAYIPRDLQRLRGRLSRGNALQRRTQLTKRSANNTQTQARGSNSWSGETCDAG